MILTTLGLLAFQYTNVPYLFGGNNPLVGLDCSGFIQLPLRTVGILNDGKDRTAQQIYNDLKEINGLRSQLDADSLLFYGESREKISHVALVLGEKLMIEAAGAGQECSRPEIARQKIARVRVVPIRNNFVACIKLEYLW